MNASIYATHSRTVARLDCLRSSFSLRIQSHSISRAWLTFNRRRDSSLSALFSLRAFRRRRSQPNSNVPFDRVARTQNVTCASNMCPRSSLSLFIFFPLSLGERLFLASPRFNSTRKMSRRHARTFSISRLRARMRFRISACCFSS